MDTLLQFYYVDISFLDYRQIYSINMNVYGLIEIYFVDAYFIGNFAPAGSLSPRVFIKCTPAAYVNWYQKNMTAIVGDNTTQSLQMMYQIQVTPINGYSSSDLNTQAFWKARNLYSISADSLPSNYTTIYSVQDPNPQPSMLSILTSINSSSIILNYHGALYALFAPGNITSAIGNITGWFPITPNSAGGGTATVTLADGSTQTVTVQSVQSAQQQIDALTNAANQQSSQVVGSGSSNVSNQTGAAVAGQTVTTVVKTVQQDVSNALNTVANDAGQAWQNVQMPFYIALGVVGLCAIALIVFEVEK